MTPAEKMRHNLRAVVDRSGMTLAGFARAVGVSESTLSRDLRRGFTQVEKWQQRLKSAGYDQSVLLDGVDSDS